MEARAFNWGGKKIIRIQAASFFIAVTTSDGACTALHCTVPFLHFSIMPLLLLLLLLLLAYLSVSACPARSSWRALTVVRLPPMFGPCTLCTGAVWQIMGDYTALATRTGFVPTRVQNIPTGAVVTDLMAGEAFGMAVLQSGAVYVTVKPDASFAARIE